MCMLQIREKKNNKWPSQFELLRFNQTIFRFWDHSAKAIDMNSIGMRASLLLLFFSTAQYIRKKQLAEDQLCVCVCVCVFCICKYCRFVSKPLISNQLNPSSILSTRMRSSLISNSNSIDI